MAKQPARRPKRLPSKRPVRCKGPRSAAYRLTSAREVARLQTLRILGYWLKERPAKRFLVEGHPSNFFKRMSALRRGARVVIALRVSTREQNKRESLTFQRLEMLRQCKAFGLVVIAVFEDIGSGWRRERSGLVRAAMFAKEHGAVLVGESVCRFIRSYRFNTKENCNVLPLVCEFIALKKEMLGVPLYTFLDPTASYSEVRAHQIKRGLAGRNAKPGRVPKAKADRKEEAKTLYERGWTVDQLAKRYDCKKRTVYYWKKEASWKR